MAVNETMQSLSFDIKKTKTLVLGGLGLMLVRFLSNAWLQLQKLKIQILENKIVKLQPSEIFII